MGQDFYIIFTALGWVEFVSLLLFMAFDDDCLNFMGSDFEGVTHWVVLGAMLSWFLVALGSSITLAHGTSKAASALIYAPIGLCIISTIFTLGFALIFIGMAVAFSVVAPFYFPVYLVVRKRRSK